MRQRASPAVDVLGGNPQAAHNVAGESPRHAPQPVAAAPRPVPPFTNPSTVPLPESNDSAVLVMENAPPTNLPETLPIGSDAKVSVSEEVPAEESVSEVVGVARSTPTCLTEDCSSSAEMQRLPAPLCPPLASETQIDSTVQELQYGSQTDKEKSHSNSQTSQIQPPREGAGLAVITGTKEKQSVTLEYKSETGTNLELGGKEHTGGSILPQSQMCFTASSPSVPQSSEHGAMEQSAGGQQDSKSPPLPLPVSDNSESGQTDLSKTQPKLIKEISNDAREIQKANSLESVEMSEHVKEFVDTSLKATQPPSAEILETPKARETLPVLYSSPGKAGSMSREDGDIQSACDPLEGEQVASSTREEQTDTATSDFRLQPESTQETSSKPSAASALFDTGLVVSLQAEPVVKAETSHPSDQVPITETPLIGEHVRSADAQEIMVVREGTHISGDWSNMRLNQSYLLQREDGSVCEAAIVNELCSEHSSGEPKLYEEGVQADIELDSQPVEVYEFCSLVEEVAEETVCASSSVQMPHSPGYEVNLFNALLENSEEYTVKEDGETIHAINESGAVIISQQPLPLTHDANQIQTCSNSNSHNLSIQNTRVTAVGQHLVLDANQAVELANSSEVCLVEVAAVTADSFTVEQTDTGAQIVTTCSQINAAVSDSPVIQTVPQKQEAEHTTGLLSLISPVVTSEDMGMKSSVAVSVHVVESQSSLNQTPAVTIVSATKPEACVSSHEGTKETPALSVTPSQQVAVTAETKPEAFITHASGIINPKLFLLKPGETPLLKHPPSLLAKVSRQQNAAGKLANAHSSRSGSASEECLPQTVAAADSLCQKDQTQCPVNKTPPVKVQQPPMSVTLHQAVSVAPTSSTSKSDNEALTVTKTSTSEADPASQDVATPPATPHTFDMLAAASVEREGTVMASNDPVSRLDSLYAEEESEEMEQDEALGETEAQEATSGQVSSPEEGSDEEPDADKTESETPSSSQKVFSWRIRN